MKILKTLFVTILLGVAGLVESQAQPTGAINGIFSVAEGQYVYFSKGNLQYNAMQGTHATADGGTAQGTWRFADHQWDYVGSDNCNISETYNGWIDLFGYGTSGWNSGATCYQPWSVSTKWTDYNPGGNIYANLEGDYAYADWGVYNAISNGGNQPSLWRTLTKDEWDYVFRLRNTLSGIRWAKAIVNGVNGLIILPDLWEESYYSLNGTNDYGTTYSVNVIDASIWTNQLESHGAVFLSACGYRAGNSGVSIYYDGNFGLYFSTTLYGLNGKCNVFEVNGYNGAGNLGLMFDDRDWGLAVRPVRQAPAISYSINAVCNPSNGGTVSGTGTYNMGSTCTLMATPNLGYDFQNWTVNGEVVSTDPTYSFMVWSDQTVVANFIPIGTITATADPEGADEITGAGVYQIGETCTLHAHSSECFTFLNWKKDGVVVSTELDYSFTVTEDADYVACFSPNSITIGVNASPSQCGTVSGGGTYYCNDPVTLTATPAEGYYFIGWNGSANGDSWFSPGNNNNPYSFNVWRNETYTALFEPIPPGIYVGDVSANSREGLPAGNENSLTQQIYTASEIGMPGGGRLYGVSFFVSDFHYSYNVTYDCDIYLVHTNKSSYNDGNDWVPVTEADRVFSGQVAMQKAQWTTIAFDTPFEYDGTSNLALMVNNNSEVGNNVYFRVFDTPDYQAISRYVYQESYDPFSPPTGGLLTRKNQIIFIPYSYIISAMANPAEGGTVTGAGEFAAGGFHTMTATANEGYLFANWMENGEVISREESYSFTVERDRALVANFVAIDINLSPGPYVDLGLPSGNQWASCNIGAETPESYGNYFAWGETQPKDYYGWSTYQHCNGSEYTLTKYCFNEWFGYNGFTDNLTVLLPEDDAATVNLGEGCHVPTEAEWHELVANTINVWTTINGVNGMLFVASNGNSIFLPSAGYYHNNLLYVSRSEYWSGCLDSSYPPDLAVCLSFSSNFFSECEKEDRAYGLSIRPVHSSNQCVVSVSANPSVGGAVSGAGSYQHGQTCTLTATPDEDFIFLNWTENGEIVSTETEYSFEVTEDRMLVANFAEVTFLYVFDGTAANNHVPISSMYCTRFLKSETVYPADQIGVMSGATINGMRFFASQLNVNWGNSATFKVFLKEVEDATISVFSGTDGATVVYEGSLCISDGVMDVAFTTPYQYYGGNLIVGFYKTSRSSLSSNNSWYGMTVEGASVQGSNRNSLANISPEQQNFIPKTMFSYCSDTPVPIYSVTGSASPLQGGSVEGTGSFREGRTCTLTATASTGYAFKYWTENGEIVSTNAEYSFVVTEDRDLVACFTLPLPSLCDSFDDGVIDTELWPFPSSGNESGGWMSITYGDGLTSNFISVPESGVILVDRVFKITKPGIANSLKGYYLFFNEDEASYIHIKYNDGMYLTSEINGVFSEIFLCDVAYNKSHLEAVRIDVLSGTLSYCLNNQLISTIEIPGLTDLQPSFFKTWFYSQGNRHEMDYININASHPDCNITASADPVFGGSVSGDGTYGYGNICALTATSVEGSTFMYWTENGQQVSSDSTYSFIVTQDRNLVANFAAATQTQTVQLSPGWNWFSTYLSGEPTELLQMLENSLGSNGIVIKSNAVSTDYYDDYGWYGDLDDEGLKSSQMYMIKTNTACTVELEGVPATSAEVGITIRHGWNWIGFPCAEAMSVADALAGFQAEDGDILKSSGASTDYYEGFGWYGELETMEPGEGFMYYSNSQTTKTVYFQTGAKKSLTGRKN